MEKRSSEYQATVEKEESDRGSCRHFLTTHAQWVAKSES